MTTTQIVALLRAAEEEIHSQQDAHPEISYAVSGTATLIRASLAVSAGMHHDAPRRRHLATVAQIASSNLSDALARRPHLLQSAELLRDCALSLLSIAAAAREASPCPA